MSSIEIILLAAAIYFAIAGIIYLFTRDVAKSLFWVFYILGDVIEAIGDSDIDFWLTYRHVAHRSEQSADTRQVVGSIPTVSTA